MIEQYFDRSSPFLTSPYTGVRIEFSANAVKATTEPNFAPSRHRSKRLHKKLLKRFGYKTEPCIWHIKALNVIVAHPSLKKAIEDGIAERNAAIKAETKRAGDDMKHHMEDALVHAMRGLKWNPRKIINTEVA